jgi:hypothetical protein
VDLPFEQEIVYGMQTEMADPLPAAGENQQVLLRLSKPDFTKSYAYQNGFEVQGGSLDLIVTVLMGKYETVQLQNQ